MRFQNRDGELLKAIYENEGVLARRQIKLMFWPNSSFRAMEKRLSKLKNSGYILWPTIEQRRYHPIPEPICWLGHKGIEYVASELGAKVSPPNNATEYQLRKFRKDLRNNNIRWLREPRWSLLRHDLAVIDFKLAIITSLSELPNISMKNWIPESVFRADFDTVTYEVRNKDGNTKRIKKGIAPDAYFEIIDEVRREKGDLYRKRYLLELDMSTHPNRRFGRDKAVPGAAYIKSPEYKSRFGHNIGNWLIVTSGGETRLRNLMRQTEKNVNEDVKWFFFTTIDKLGSQNALTSPIWHKVGIDQPIPLLE